MSEWNTNTADLGKDLRESIADLQDVNPAVGLLRCLGLGIAVLGSIGLAWSAGGDVGFWSWTAIAGLCYAFWIICTHDAVHHTLFGWEWIDELLARAIAWPMLLPIGSYSELHKLHHGWNGINLRDPERVQWTVEEYERAHPLVRWYVRHQWGCDILVLGGLGLIVKTFANGVRYQSLLPRLRWQLMLDVGGMLLLHGSLIALVLLAQRGVLRYVLFWFALERLVGTVVQARDHLEHYGLWGKAKGHQLTQLYSCRNLRTTRAIGWLMGGLNYHAVHHAFPDIPFNRLPEAHERIQGVLGEHGLPVMGVAGGYFEESLRMGQRPLLIGEDREIEPPWRNDMVVAG